MEIHIRDPKKDQILLPNVIILDAFRKFLRISLKKRKWQTLGGLEIYQTGDPQAEIGHDTFGPPYFSGPA